MASTETVTSTSQPEAQPSPTPTAAPAAPEPLPKLSASDFRAYNRLADMMNAYHNHFRHEWTTLSNACTANKRPQGMSIRQFLSLGESFCRSLTMHHNIEESYIFPELARRMPAFRDQREMKSQHKQIHEGLEVFEKYLQDCRRGETELRLEEMGRIMGTFGEVLWKHLDDEVLQLGAENMRRYWTKEEIRAIPF